MRRLIVLSLVCFTFHSILVAQAPPKFEVFGGYSLLHDGSSVPTNFSGWDAAPTAYLNRWLGVTAEFAGHYSTQTIYSTAADLFSKQRIYMFMVGPHFRYRRSRYVLFAEPLAGVNHTGYNESVLSGGTCSPASSCLTVGAPQSGTYNSFSAAANAGLDIEMGHGIALRPVQAEYVLRRVSGLNYSQYRYSAGLVFRPKKPRRRLKEPAPPPPAIRY